MSPVRPTTSSVRPILERTPNSSQSSALSDIINHALHMQRDGYKPSTIESQVSALKNIAHHANLYNPDAVKTYLANLNVTEARKEALVIRLNRFYKWKGISWVRTHPP